MRRITVVGLLLMLFTFACAGSDTVRVALDWTPNTNHTGLLVASELGYLAEANLELRLLEGGPTAPMQLVATGNAEFGISSQEYVTMARAQGLPVVSVAALFPHNTSGFASAVDRHIQSPSDFVDRTYAGWGSAMEEQMIRTVMELDGADPRRVNISTMGTIDFTTAIRLNVADFYWIFYGWQGVHAELLGIEFDYIPLRDLAPVLDYYTPVLITSERVIEEQGDMVRDFLNAVARGYACAAIDPDASAELLLDYAPELDRDLVIASQRWLAAESETDIGQWGRQQSSVWTEFADWALAYGLIEAAIDPEAAFTNSLLPTPTEDDD